MEPWSPAQCLAMKRQALLDCIHAAKERYPQAWARTSVDLAIQVLLFLALARLGPPGAGLSSLGLGHLQPCFHLSGGNGQEVGCAQLGPTRWQPGRLCVRWCGDHSLLSWRAISLRWHPGTSGCQARNLMPCPACCRPESAHKCSED